MKPLKCYMLSSPYLSSRCLLPSLLNLSLHLPPSILISCCKLDPLQGDVLLEVVQETIYCPLLFLSFSSSVTLFFDEKDQVTPHSHLHFSLSSKKPLNEATHEEQKHSYPPPDNDKLALHLSLQQYKATKYFQVCIRFGLLPFRLAALLKTTLGVCPQMALRVCRRRKGTDELQSVLEVDILKSGTLNKQIIVSKNIYIFFFCVRNQVRRIFLKHT